MVDEPIHMHRAYRVWWRVLMDLRPLVRFVGERFPWTHSFGVRSRSILHLAVGNPVQTTALLLATVAWRAGGPWWLAGAGWLVVAAGFEYWQWLTYERAGWLVGWREAWRIRRQFPALWASVAAKTHQVQAEVGTSNEPIASAVRRPVADHPKMGWWPRIEWPLVSWWVGPPPGRTFASLEQVTDALAANLSHAIDVRVDYRRSIDSYGRLTISFEDRFPTTPSSFEDRFPTTPSPVPLRPEEDNEPGDELRSAI